MFKYGNMRYASTCLGIYRSDISLWLLIRTNVCLFLVKQNIFKTMRPRENGRHVADVIFKCISWNIELCILIPIYLKFNLNVIEICS